MRDEPDDGGQERPSPSESRLAYAIVAYACVTVAMVIPVSWFGLVLAGAGLVFALVAACRRHAAAGASVRFC